MRTDVIERRAFIAALGAALAAASAAGRAFADPLQTDAAGAAYAALVRAIAPFDDPAFPALDADELERRIARIVDWRNDPGFRAGLIALDRSCAPGGFAGLSVHDARIALDGWLHADDVRQRAFVAGSRAVIMIALYGSPEMWPAIGYAGPFETLR